MLRLCAEKPILSLLFFLMSLRVHFLRTDESRLWAGAH